MTRVRRPRLVTAFALLVPFAAACGAHQAEPPSASFDAAVAGEAIEASEPEQLDRAMASEDTRMVIRHASLQLRADGPQAVVARVTQLTEQAGGYVAASSTQGVGDQIQQVDATLRVPSERFEAVLQSLRTQGELLHESLSGQDVTQQHSDLSAQLRSKRALEERLLTILSKVVNVQDALKVETELTSVRTQIEQLEGSKQLMESSVSMATIEFSVASPVLLNPADAESVTSRLDRALDDAGRGFVAVLAGLIRILGVLLPLGLLAVPLGLAAQMALVRRRRRQSR